MLKLLGVRGKQASEGDDEVPLMDVENGTVKAKGGGDASKGGDAAEKTVKKSFWVEHKAQLLELAPFLWCVPPPATGLCVAAC